MTSRQRCCRGALLVSTLLIVAAISSGGFSQQSSPLIEAPLPPVSLPQPNEPALPPPPPAESVDSLIDRLAKLRAQKLDLERKEQSVITRLRDRLQNQKDRLVQLGVADALVRPESAEPPLAP
jgi:hypothetical protein